ncbi:ABC transporter substrate-binding protein [Streptomyces sp. LP05-1]|uniref:ABC transporter substrate-binding protein n=1 Tax=Streptomyces pyxinae TaxID=2970734 RepID=A0ABT2CK73_9ACTN|nr:Ada metal-binding domain-containing protein [Streptomyces sp. LP05-1]MCS0637807.1 ABC transporter substrate-binding protein [Streptomyces sp. LP05-1]
MPGTLGGHRRGRLYGRLDCPSALRALSRGGYARERVFFADEATARAAGYRPCAVCLPAAYARWKAAAGPAAQDPGGGPDGGPPGEAGESPLVHPGERAAYGELPAPVPHTRAELDSIVRQLVAHRPRVEAVAVGHGRAAASVAAAGAFTAAWEARGGTVLAVVDWPETAASWLRPARRLTAGAPDAWVIAAAPYGFVQLARRLRHSTDWDPARTWAFGALSDSRLPALAGPGVLHGLRGAAPDGAPWEVRGGWVTHR